MRSNPHLKTKIKQIEKKEYQEKINRSQGFSQSLKIK